MAVLQQRYDKEELTQQRQVLPVFSSKDHGLNKIQNLAGG
jgi:hypothetical protein